MRDHGGDIAALQAGLHVRQPAPNGLRLYTTDFDSVSLCDFYRRRQAFLILSGPSLAQHDLTLLDKRGILTMAVNNAWAVHRPHLWTCVDGPGLFIDTGWKDPGILKLVPMVHWNAHLRTRQSDGKLVKSQSRVKQMPSVLLYRRNEHFDHRRFLDEDTICWGNSSQTKDSLGLQGKRSVMMVALRLLHYLGCRTVYLVGADFKMSPVQKYAFDENRTANAIRHNNMLFAALNRRFEALREHFQQANFTVFNCTPESGLTAFKHMPYAQAVEKVAAECSKDVDTKGWYS